MKINVKFNIGTNDYPETPLTEGEHTVSDKLGQELIDRGYAEPVVTAEAKAPAIKGEKK